MSTFLFLTGCAAQHVFKDPTVTEDPPFAAEAPIVVSCEDGVVKHAVQDYLECEFGSEYHIRVAFFQVRKEVSGDSHTIYTSGTIISGKRRIPFEVHSEPGWSKYFLSFEGCARDIALRIRNKIITDLPLTRFAST